MALLIVVIAGAVFALSESQTSPARSSAPTSSALPRATLSTEAAKARDALRAFGSVKGELDRELDGTRQDAINLSPADELELAASSYDFSADALTLILFPPSASSAGQRVRNAWTTYATALHAQADRILRDPAAAAPKDYAQRMREVTEAEDALELELKRLAKA